MLIFPLFQMGATSSSLVHGSIATPLTCALKNWKKFDPEILKKKHLIFFWTKAWPLYNLSDGERWPSEGSLAYNTILQWDPFGRGEGEWSELPYVRSPLQWGKTLHWGRLMPTPSRPRCPPYPGPTGSDPPEVNQPSPIPPKAPLPPPVPKLYPPLLSLQEEADREWGPIQVHTPISLQDLRQIKTDLGKFADDPDILRSFRVSCSPLS